MFDLFPVFQFLQDLYSGKLHREFHYGPDKVSEPAPGDSGQNPGGDGLNAQVPDNSQNEVSLEGNRQIWSFTKVFLYVSRMHVHDGNEL